MSKRLYIDFHILQTVPPSCVNRDDTGSPKTAIYGGTMRARVSSQSWKRAMRLMFRETFDSDDLGYRTKNTVHLVANQIRKNNLSVDEDKAEKMAADILELAGVKSEKGKDVLFFISTRQVESIALLAQEYSDVLDNLDKSKKDKDVNRKNNNKKDKKANDEKANDLKYRATKILIEDPSIDILLFGRMAAGNVSLNYDAAAQVAHSISTHTISNEYDYFTAVDDYKTDDNAGAAHVDTNEYNSSTLYRYATVNVAELSKNLDKEELAKTVSGFADAFIRSMPTGKQNTFANRTLPDLVYVTVRKDQPVNLAGAFERPVSPGQEGYVNKSIKALFTYAESVYENYVSEPCQAWVIGGSTDLPAQKVNLKGLLSQLEDTIGGCFAEEE